ncbi:hypothetical protein [Soonwooa sp.]|uniref:MutS-related protein n=1 Tax=Soonwooa sp. TaxID=1938592 RepID=UPI002629B656|nr:hypothetical protein [Soonwooa sp.]
MDFDFNTIKKYFKYKSKLGQYFQVISDETAEDLNLDLVFLKLDKNISKIGQQFFYSKLRIIEQEKDKSLEKYIEFFNTQDSKKVEKDLEKLNKEKDYEIIDLIENDIFINQKILNYAKLSIGFLIVILICGCFVKQCLALLFPLFLLNAYHHYSNKSYVEFYNSIISRLHTMLVVAKNIGKTETFANDYKSIKLKKLENSFWSSHLTEQLAKNEFLIVFWAILELCRIMFNLEIFGFARKAKILNTSKNELLQVFEFVGKIDTANTIAKIRKDFTTTEPKFSSIKKLEVKNIYHPLIDNCVKNDLTLENSSIVLTGSNMSGKTSFMRVVAVNALFAQSFGFCFADYYSAPFMKILTSISVQDDINDSKSYYLEEVLRIKEFLEESTDYKLILIDEIFKGTNTKERIAISKSVLNTLNSSKNIVFITTHDLEIATFLEQHNYQLYYFSESLDSETIKFTYKINSGINTKTNAIRILEMYDYPQAIVSEAYKLLD